MYNSWPQDRILTANRRIPALDGLRGAAILAVLLYHAQASPDHPGWLGVDFFFVVSGFLITGILLDSRREPRYYSVFYARRSLRIFPLYYASLFCLFVAAPVMLRFLHRPEVADNVLKPSTQSFAWTYTLNWLVGVQTFAAISLYIQHFWSLSVEEQFYLCWPAVVKRVGESALVRLCLALALLAPVLRIVLQRVGLPEAGYAWTISRCDGLAIGGALAVAARDPRAWAVLSRVAPAAASVALLVLTAIGAASGVQRLDPWFGTIGISVAAVLFGAILVIAVNARSGLPARVLAGGPLAFLGKYSYAIYVFHLPILATMAWKGVLYGRLAASLGGPAAAAVYYALAITLPTLCALASWTLVERPCLHLKEALTDRLRRPRTREAAQAV